jgi:hypothetical protein
VKGKTEKMTTANASRNPGSTSAETPKSEITYFSYVKHGGGTKVLGHIGQLYFYSIYYGNEGASSSVSDVGPYVTIRMFVHYIFNIYFDISTPVGNSDIFTQDFFSTKLSAQGDISVCYVLARRIDGFY